MYQVGHHALHNTPALYSLDDSLQRTLHNDDIINTMLRVVLKAGAREDLGAFDSSMSGFLWFDKQSVRRLAAKVYSDVSSPTHRSFHLQRRESDTFTGSAELKLFTFISIL